MSLTKLKQCLRAFYGITNIHSEMYTKRVGHSSSVTHVFREMRVQRLPKLPAWLGLESAYDRRDRAVDCIERRTVSVTPPTALPAVFAVPLAASAQCQTLSDDKE